MWFPPFFHFFLFSIYSLILFFLTDFLYNSLLLQFPVFSILSTHYLPETVSTVTVRLCCQLTHVNISIRQNQISILPLNPFPLPLLKLHPFRLYRVNWLLCSSISSSLWLLPFFSCDYFLMANRSWSCSAMRTACSGCESKQTGSACMCVFYVYMKKRRGEQRGKNTQLSRSWCIF